MAVPRMSKADMTRWLDRLLLLEHGVCGLTDPYFTIEADSDAEAAEGLLELAVERGK